MPPVPALIPSPARRYAARPALGCLVAAAALAVARTAFAGLPAGPQLVQQLRAGGYVLVMRHAQSPLAAPSAREAEPDNPRRERELSESGKASARALGAALRALHIPFGPIYSSPTFRALQTIRLADLDHPITVPQLAEGAHGMSRAAGAARAAWLREAVRRPAPAGSNTLIVTHTPNIVGAFGHGVADIEAGEMLVFEPARSGPASLVGRIRIAEWEQLARRR